MAQTKKTKSTAGNLPKVKYPGRLEILLAGGPTVRKLPLGQQVYLADGTLVAALLSAEELAPHLYIVHEASKGRRPTLLVSASKAELGAKASASVRIPQKGAWLSCPGHGQVIVVASRVSLTRKQIADILKGRSGNPAKATDTNI